MRFFKGIVFAVAVLASTHFVYSQGLPPSASFGAGYSGASTTATGTLGDMTAGGINGTLDNFSVNHIFNPKAPQFGAKGDARISSAYDVTIASGNLLSSATLAPVAGDVGKTAICYGCGTDGTLQGVGAFGTINRATGVGSITFATAPTNLQVLQSTERIGTVFTTDTAIFTPATGDGATTTFTFTTSVNPLDTRTERVESLTGHSGGNVAAVDIGASDFISTVDSVASGVATLHTGGASSPSSDGTTLSGRAVLGTDDTAAFQAMLTAATAAGQLCKEGGNNATCNVQIKCPPAQYLIAGTLVLNASNVTLDCSAATFYVANATSTPWFTIGAAGTHNHDVIANLGHVYGNWPVSARTTGVRVLNASNVSVHGFLERFVLGFENGTTAGTVNQWTDISDLLMDFNVVGGQFHQCDYCGGTRPAAEQFADRGLILGEIAAGQVSTLNTFTWDRGVTQTVYGSASFGLDVGSVNGFSASKCYHESGVGTANTTYVQAMRFAGTNTNSNVNGWSITDCTLSDTSHTFTGTPASPRDAIKLNGSGTSTAGRSFSNKIGLTGTTSWANGFTTDSNQSNTLLGNDDLTGSTGAECPNAGSAVNYQNSGHSGTCLKTTATTSDSPLAMGSNKITGIADASASGDALSNGNVPPFTWSTFFNSLIAGQNTRAQLIPAFAIKVIRVTLACQTAPHTCSPAGLIRVTDGSSNIDTTLVNDTLTYDSGALTQNYGSGATISANMNTLAAGCGTNPNNCSLVVEYTHQ